MTGVADGGEGGTVGVFLSSDPRETGLDASNSRADVGRVLVDGRVAGGSEFVRWFPSPKRSCRERSMSLKVIMTDEGVDVRLWKASSK